MTEEDLDARYARSIGALNCGTTTTRITNFPLSTQTATNVLSINGGLNSTGAWPCLGAFVTTLVGCSDNVTAWRKDDPGGLYPAGEISGEPTFGIGWHRRLY